MKNLWHSIAPFASDTSGACTVFAHSPALILAQDSNGSVSVLRRIIDINRANADFETVDLPEVAYTLGHEKDFQDRMVELYEGGVEFRASNQLEPYAFSVMVNGPVATLVGFDLQGRARLFEETTGLQSIVVNTTGNRYYEKGIEEAYASIYANFVDKAAGAAKSAMKVRGDVGILGMTELDYPGSTPMNLLARSLRGEGKRVVTNWGYTDTHVQWRHATEAQENIVASVGGLKIARLMEQELGIPFRTIDEFDFFGSCTEGLAIEPSLSILIIGEQLSSNLLRTSLRKIGAEKVTVMSFFTLDRDYKESGDKKLKSESDLRAVLETGEYDLVIGDAVLRGCGAKHFMPLMHPPTGFGHRDNTALNREWFEKLAKRCGEIMGTPRAAQLSDARRTDITPLRKKTENSGFDFSL